MNYTHIIEDRLKEALGELLERMPKGSTKEYSYEFLEKLRKEMYAKVDEMIIEEFSEFLFGLHESFNKFMEDHDMRKQITEIQAEIKKEFAGEFTIPTQTTQQTIEFVEGTDTTVEKMYEEQKEDFYIPRNKYGRIHWSRCDDDSRMEIVFHFVMQAEEMGVDIHSGRNLKNLGGDFSGCYQQGLKLFQGKGSWDSLITKYYDWKELGEER